MEGPGWKVFCPWSQFPRYPFFSHPAGQEYLLLWNHPVPFLLYPICPHPLLSRLAYYAICIGFLNKPFMWSFCFLKLLGETFAFGWHRSSQSINIWRSRKETRSEVGKEEKGQGREGLLLWTWHLVSSSQEALTVIPQTYIIIGIHYHFSDNWDSETGCHFLKWQWHRIWTQMCLGDRTQAQRAAWSPLARYGADFSLGRV